MFERFRGQTDPILCDAGILAREARKLPFWTEYSPLRGILFSVFDNKVERASREMNDSGASSSDLTR